MGPLQTEMTHFPNLSYSSTSEISPEPGPSFWEELSHIGCYKEYPGSGTAEKFFNGEGCIGRNRATTGIKSILVCNSQGNILSWQNVHQSLQVSFMKESLFDDLNIFMIA